MIKIAHSRGYRLSVSFVIKIERSVVEVHVFQCFLLWYLGRDSESRDFTGINC